MSEKEVNIKSVFDEDGEFYIEEKFIARLMNASYSLVAQLESAMTSGNPNEIEEAKARVTRFRDFNEGMENLLEAAHKFSQPLKRHE